MALIKCPECGREVSDKAPACPHCGAPILSEFIEKKVKKYKTTKYLDIITVAISLFAWKYLEVGWPLTVFAVISGATGYFHSLLALSRYQR